MDGAGYAVDMDPRLSNYRVEVFQHGVSLATTVMERADLHLLLKVAGHLELADFESWLAAIADVTQRPWFTLDAKGTVTYHVTLTPERATHANSSVH